MLLLVVRCLAFAVVQAETMARGNAGAAGNGGSIRLRFDRQLRFASARIRIFGKLGRQNVSRFIGRALFNGGSFVGFDWGNRFSWSFCRRALGRAVLNEDAGAVRRSVAGSLGQY